MLCEYDALPGIGHACGHNIIGTAGLGAGLAAAALAEEAGGRVLILGTPAEEGGGGKVFMAEQGALEGVDAAMMVHPAGADLRSMNAIAIQQCHVRYEGKAAHAAAAPHKGRNALDAAVLGYMNIAALRQHIKPDERIHGIFTDSGDAANIVPAKAGAIWYVRSPKMRKLDAAQAAGPRLPRGRHEGRRLHDDLRVEGPGLRRPGRPRALRRPVRRERGPARPRRCTTTGASPASWAAPTWAT